MDSHRTWAFGFSPRGSLTPAQGKPRRPHEAWRKSALMAVVYLIAAYGTATLLRQYYVASPLSLQAGLGLAAVLCWGWRAAPAVLVAHTLAALAVSASKGSASLGGALPFGAGAALQALGGAWLLRKALRGRTELSRGSDILLFMLLGGLTTPAIGASAGVATLALAYHVTDIAQLQGIWLDFWISNAAGIVVCTPIALAFIAHPREVWAPRLVNTALPLLLAALLLTLVITILPRWDLQRRQRDFEREASAAAAAVAEALQQPMRILAATDSLLGIAPKIGARAFSEAAAHIVPAAGPVDFVGLLGPGEPVGAAAPGRLTPLLSHARPAQSAPAFDLDAATPTLIAAALASTQEGGAAIASAAFGNAGAGTGTHVALVRALPPPAAGTPGRMLVVAIDMPRLLQQVLAQRPSGLAACLLDKGADSPTQVLVGMPGCELAQHTQAAESFALEFATRRWTLHLNPVAAPALHSGPRAQLIAIASMLTLAMFATLLLRLSARARQVKTVVGQHTSALQTTSRALRSTEQRLRSVFEHAPVGIYVADLEGRLLAANPHFCALLGCTTGELARRHAGFAAEDAALARRLVEETSTNLSVQRHYAQPDGSQMLVELRLCLQRDARGKPQTLLCVAQDITARAQLEALERKRQAAELANQAKNIFLSRMSHELRTPLNGLLGFTQLLQADSAQLNAAQQARLTRISQAGWHLLAMVNDVLDLTQVETGHVAVLPEALDAGQLVEEAVTLLGSSAARRGIAIQVRMAPPGSWVMADPTRIREILNNLLTNAIKYNRRDGEVRVDVRQDEPAWIDFCVSDTGPGMTAQQLGALFQPFNRLGQEGGTIEGTGIGLTISRQLAELMKGSLSVLSEPGRGSSFTLRLPAAQPPADAAVSTPQREASPRRREARRLVYIEDNPVNAELMRATLRERPALQLDLHADGASGLAEVLRHPPDLLLLDYHLPGCDVDAWLEELRATERGAALPVLIVSADAMDTSIQQALHSGATHYITKPFVVRELLDLVDRLLSKPDREG